VAIPNKKVRSVSRGLPRCARNDVNIKKRRQLSIDKNYTRSSVNAYSSEDA